MDIIRDKFINFSFFDIYFFISFISLAIVSLIFYSKIGENIKTSILLFLIFFLIEIFIIKSIFLTIAQYLIWLNHPLSKYLVPPYANSIYYFLDYAMSRFWLDLFFRLIGVLVVISIIFAINFILKREIFYEDEKLLMSYITLIFFFPYNLVIIFLGFVTLLFSWLIKIIFCSKKFELTEERLSFRNYWLVVAWLCFLLQPFVLVNYSFLKYRPF